MRALSLTSHPPKTFPLLVVEDNRDHQVLIDYGLRAKMSQAKPTFVITPKEALLHLHLAADNPIIFPRLVLMDLNLPVEELGWQLLNQIRLRYPGLPIIMLSGQQDDEAVSQAYDLGVSSFLAKPNGVDGWEAIFRMLNDYWLNTVILPPV